MKIRESRTIKIPERYKSDIGYTPEKKLKEEINTEISNITEITDTKIESNPWNVENFEAFLFYECPECLFHSNERSQFAIHIASKHVKVYMKIFLLYFIHIVFVNIKHNFFRLWTS